MRKHFLFLIIMLCKITIAVAQTPHIDSLLAALKTMKEDTSKINLLNDITRAYIYEVNDVEQLQHYTEQQLKLAEKLNSKKGFAFGYMNMAIIYVSRSDYRIALDYNQKSLKLMQEIGNKKGESSCYINMGQNYSNLGDYTSAITFMLKGVKIKEEINDKRGVAVGYGNIGSIFFAQEKYPEALRYYLNSLKIKEEINDKTGMAMSYNNIGSVFQIQKKSAEALAYYKKSLELKEKLGNKKGTATTYSNIGDIYFSQGKINQALAYQLKSLEIAKSITDKKGMLTAYNRIGAVFEKKKKYKEAIDYYNMMLLLSKESELKEGTMTGYKSISEAYQNAMQFDSAFHYISLYYALKDSIFNKDNFKQLAELNTRYETDKKEKEILLLTKDQQLNAKIIKQQQLVRWGLIGGLALLSVSIFSIYRRYRFKQKANVILEKQKEEIQLKNVLITDSIDYAQTIQEAVLPTRQEIQEMIPDSFVLYKPKATVSGDFYWLGQVNERLVCAVADCTGHGVPGAFMSLLGYNMLENAVKDLQTAKPAHILDTLNEEVNHRLAGGELGEDSKHGMDISLISIDTKTNLLEFAGAHNSIYIVRANELIELKADKMGIGGNKLNEAGFKNQETTLQKGDMIYLFTDGFPDQIGGPNRKKFYYRPFKELLLEISTLQPEEQRKKLNDTHLTWMGEKMDQTDDILIMGIRISNTRTSLNV